MYTGIKEIILTQEQQANFFLGKEGIIDTSELFLNEYVVLKDENGEYLKDQAYKFNGTVLMPVKYSIIENYTIGDIKPRRNIKQRCFIDLLNNNDIKLKVVTGGFGVGKSFVSTAWALREMEKKLAKKIVIIRNNIDVADVPAIGALPGTINDKLRPYCAYIADITDEENFEMLLLRRQIEIAYLGTVRGRSFMDSIVLCSEAQNLTTDHIKLIVSRIGENSTLIFDFDLQQKDKKIFADDNGMMSLVQSLSGHPKFGMVSLDKVERSDIAEMAELIRPYQAPKKVSKKSDT